MIYFILSFQEGGALVAVIYICENDPVDVLAAKDGVRKFMCDNALSLSVQTFSAAEYLLYELQDGNFADLYILDISLPDMDGIAAAMEIRKIVRNPRIIFISTYAERAIEGYRVKALDFIQKHDLKTALPRALSEIFSGLYETEEAHITLQTKSDILHLPVSQLIMAESVERAVEVTTVRENVRVNRRIHEIYDELNDPRFLFIDRSRFVNLDYVSRVKKTEIELTTETVLPISRRAHPKIMDAIRERWER